jgi:hypothetical protein
MPKCPPPALSATRSQRPRLLLEAFVLLCVAVVAICAGIAAHSAQWHNVCLLIGVLVMIPMCWAAERTLDTSHSTNT